MMADEDRVSGAASGGPAPRVTAPVHTLRPAGLPHPNAYAVAMDRLAEAMMTTATIRRSDGDIWRMAIRLAITAAPHGDHTMAVERILAVMLKRIEAHMATVPYQPPGDGA